MSAIAPGLVLLAFLCGSISSAILVCRLLACPTHATAAQATPGPLTYSRIGGKGGVAAILF